MPFRNTTTRSKVLQFVFDMTESLIDTANIETQTDIEVDSSTEEKGVQTENDHVQEIMEQLSKLEKEEDILYVFQNFFHIQTDQMKALNIIQAIQTLEPTQQNMFFNFLLNEKSLFEHLLELVQ